MENEEVSILCLKLQIGIQKNLCKTATLKKTENWFSRPIIAKCRPKYCRMFQGEHSVILLTFIKLPFVIKIFVLSFFEWPFYIGFTVYETVLKITHLPEHDILVLCLIAGESSQGCGESVHVGEPVHLHSTDVGEDSD